MKGSMLCCAFPLLLAACASTGSPPDVDAAAMVDVPDRFLVVDPATGETSEPSGPTCRNPVADPRDGMQLVLVRSISGVGDYRPPTPRYGIGQGELLRIRCSDGRPMGVVEEGT